ncbi:BMC domain-containing protein [Acetobacterium sp. K1/6]|uniref:BMC domain-containing protein n=1 Tax=Acetobacterium sp. K1/6 TaxID=3055467 RepID=UPI002ACA9FCC|nr:BMC domain-containing protein [Acetobacterium sp. K1/6]MDZ5724799.1 BMC domain-containing protein [Acetobacterium sp. K1/6]
MNRREAVGLIEAIGLATAIEAADAAVKSANVRLIGYEACKGDGMSTIKVAGDIGAVKAAVDAATAACAKGRGVWATKVIARPSEGIEKLIYNNQTVGFTPPVEPEAEVVTKAVTIEENVETAEENVETAEENEETAEENTEE